MTKQIKKRAGAKRAKLYQTTKRWKLSHRTHTGRMLPHAHTSYPALAMVMLCVGVLMGGLNQVSKAAPPDDIVVTARLLGQAPATAATIDTPTDGSGYSTKPIIVSGTCPADTYIELIRNGIASGVALCQPDLTYSLSTDLFDGANALQAQVYNTTDVPGPVSSSVTVFYNRPAPAGSSAQPQSIRSSAAPSKSPLLLQTDFTFTGHYVGETVTFEFTVSGGQSPYAISVTWGDGSTKLLTIEKSGLFKVEHVYQKAGPDSGSYTVGVKVADAAGNETVLQTITQITDRPGTATAGSADGEAGRSSLFPSFSAEAIKSIIWSAYSLVAVMVFSFWLGERHEVKMLKGHIRPHHRA